MSESKIGRPRKNTEPISVAAVKTAIAAYAAKPSWYGMSMLQAARTSCGPVIAKSEGNQWKCQVCVDDCILARKHVPDHFWAKHRDVKAVLESARMWCQDGESATASAPSGVVSFVNHRKVNHHAIQRAAVANVKYIINSGLALGHLSQEAFMELLVGHGTPVEQIKASCGGRKWAEAQMRRLTFQLRRDLTAKLADAVGVCLSSDGWSTKQGEELHSVNAYFIDREGELVHVLLGLCHATSSSDAEGVKAQLLSTLGRYGVPLSKIVAFTSDGAPVMTAAAKLLSVPFIHCAAHVVHLVVQVRS